MVIYRRHHRLELELPVTLRTEGDELHAMTSDVSISGARVCTPDLIPLRSRLHMWLDQPGAPRLWAEVLRAERQRDMWELGIEFRTPSVAARALWSKMIINALLRSGKDTARPTLAAPIHTLEALTSFIERELACGETFWPTTSVPEAGTIVDVVFTHPEDASRFVAPMYVTTPTDTGFYSSLAMFDEPAFLTFVERGLRHCG